MGFFSCSFLSGELCTSFSSLSLWIWYTTTGRPSQALSPCSSKFEIQDYFPMRLSKVRAAFSPRLEVGVAGVGEGNFRVIKTTECLQRVLIASRF